MQTKLGYYADKILEMGWLAAAVVVPIFFNVYSSRVFEPDKISILRTLVLIMTVAWLVKLLEGAYSSLTARNEASTHAASDAQGRNKVAVALDGAGRAGLPSWLGFLRVPLVIPVLVYALAYLISSIFTVTPDATIWGSYQRLEGTYTQYSYMMLAFIIIANLRTRVQFERLINFMLLASVPVAVYGIGQALHLDPLPWAGDTASRVASSMGNAIFVAAWLIMLVPLAAYKLFVGVSATISARAAATDPLPAAAPAAPMTDVERRRMARTRPADAPSYSWAAVMCSVGVIFSQIFFFYLALKIAAGLPYPDAALWWVMPLAIALFYGGCWLIQWFGNHRDDARLSSVFVPATGVALFFVSVLALVFTWALDNTQTPSGGQDLKAHIGLDGSGFLWVLFFMLLWGTIGAGLYALASRERQSGDTTPDRGIMRVSLNAGYSVLIFVQLLCIYLSQSRGPWLGLGASFVVFALAMWLVGRRNGVRWMSRIGGWVSAIALGLAIFVGLLNIPSSPLQSLSSLPILGRGLDRLSTLAQTESGTGQVRELIWQGATNLIISDPVRAIIGWGPEAMYVAYNPYYPAQLAQVELRNATPDRSHNVEFDHLVTMGVMGLLAYYFLVASFFFAAIRALKRATNIRDQLLLITFISVMTAHFVEIQTGIQIASTWTYFYIFVALLSVFGFFLTNYLRKSEAGALQLASASEVGGNGHASHDEHAAEEARTLVGARSGRGGVASSAPAGVATLASTNGGNGRASVSTSVPGVRRRTTSAGGPQNPQSARTGGTSQTRSGGSGQTGVRRGSTSLGRGYTEPEASWVSSPAMLVLYAVLLLAGLWMAAVVNSATVQADTLYKQAQSYDQNQSWPQAISLYSRAIDLQPNQDYYYLFLGRAWLEFAKQAPNEKANNIRTGAAYPAAQSTDTSAQQTQDQKNNLARKQEELVRLQQSEQILKRAHELSPLNTDHYANLGRLYLYWGDAAGGNDQSKLPLSVENFTRATERTPGNAQIRDELAVALARNGQFDKAIQTLNYSQQSIDPTYARTPYIKGQLLQERLGTVRDALDNGTALPKEGEIDYGKLLVDASAAYSDTMLLDPSTIVDDNFKARTDALVFASEPYTKTNTKLDAATVTNVLTNTLMIGTKNSVSKQETLVSNYVREHGAYNGTGVVPLDVLQTLWQKSDWASSPSEGAARQWTDSNLQIPAHNDSLANYALAYIRAHAGYPGEPTTGYTRALALEPSNSLVVKEQQTPTPTPTPAP